MGELLNNKLETWQQCRSSHLSFAKKANVFISQNVKLLLKSKNPLEHASENGHWWCNLAFLGLFSRWALCVSDSCRLKCNIVSRYFQQINCTGVCRHQWCQSLTIKSVRTFSNNQTRSDFMINEEEEATRSSHGRPECLAAIRRVVSAELYRCPWHHFRAEN